MELPGVRSELIVDVGSVEPAHLLECWRWRVGPEFQPWFATVVGDLFLKGPAGEVHWLDVGSGDLERVAAGEADFLAALADPQQLRLWLAPVMAQRLADPASGQPALQAGQVYSYQRLPLLGGDFAPGNFRVRGLLDHFCTLGMLHRQFADNPDGAGLQFGPDE